MSKKQAKQSFYVVDSIIGKVIKLFIQRGDPDHLEYKVRWKGYSDNDSTWEPLKNLTMVIDLVNDYNRLINISGA